MVGAKRDRDAAPGCAAQGIDEDQVYRVGGDDVPFQVALAGSRDARLK